ncbi:MAG: ethanolamine ammonia-lyase light chain EutC, partial [Cloacibacillus porcorum]|uniref:ethanolamine ammonia-lyase light chain EutC n=1 Tax=Cloacibacillus porcorum TaxID=1197717 RepID=UPI0023F0BF57
MVDQNALKAIIEQVLTEMNIGNAAAVTPPSAAEAVKAGETPAAPAAEGVVKVDDGFIPDVSEIDIRKQYLVENPVNGEAYYDLKQYAPARLGIGKAGARYKTLPVLEFRAAHSAAQDAVFSQMDLEFVEKLDLFVVRTMCTSKDEYLTRPDLGRKLNPEGVA